MAASLVEAVFLLAFDIAELVNGLILEAITCSLIVAEIRPVKNARRRGFELRATSAIVGILGEIRARLPERVAVHISRTAKSLTP
jgi:hypothetical protein